MTAFIKALLERVRDESRQKHQEIWEIIFTDVPCILMLSSLLLVQLMHNQFALKY